MTEGTVRFQAPRGLFGERWVAAGERWWAADEARG